MWQFVGLSRKPQLRPQEWLEAPLEIRGDAEVIAAFLSALTYAIDATKFEDPLQRSAAIGAAQQEFAGRLSNSVENLGAFVARACSPVPN